MEATSAYPHPPIPPFILCPSEHVLCCSAPSPSHQGQASWTWGWEHLPAWKPWVAWTPPLDYRQFQHFPLSAPSQDGPQEENLRTTEGGSAGLRQEGRGHLPGPKWSQPLLPTDRPHSPGSCCPGLLRATRAAPVASGPLCGAQQVFYSLSWYIP